MSEPLIYLIKVINIIFYFNHGNHQNQFNHSSDNNCIISYIFKFILIFTKNYIKFLQRKPH